MEDVRVVYKGSVNTICFYPEYEIDQKKGTIVADKADITNEAYVNALKQMMKKAKEHKKISNYGTRIIMEKINEELIVLKLIHIKDFYYICNGKMWTPGGGVPDIKELMELKEKTPFSACEFDSFLSYADAIDVICKISYTKYGQSEEVEEINDRFTCCMEFWKKLSAKNREVETHDLKMTSFEKFGMDIDKMDELAAYFAMEYFFEYDIARIQQTKRTTRISSGTETFYDILHRQNTTMEYCETLKSFFGEMPLDKIVQAY